MSSVVSAGFLFVVKGRPFHRCGEGVLCLGKLSAGYVAMCCAFLGRALDSVCWGIISSKMEELFILR